MDFRILRRFLAPLERRIMGYMAKALVTSVIEGGPLQTLQIDLGNGEVKDGIQRIQNFGFTSFPKKGAQAIVLFYGGMRDHGYVVSLDDGNFRPHVAEGESAQYSAFGSIIHLKADGSVEIVPKSGAKIVLSGETVIQGNTTINGDIETTGKVDANQGITSKLDVKAGPTGISLLTHTHTVAGVTPGSGAVPTTPPLP